MTGRYILSIKQLQCDILDKKLKGENISLMSEAIVLKKSALCAFDSFSFMIILLLKTPKSSAATSFPVFFPIVV